MTLSLKAYAALMADLLGAGHAVTTRVTGASMSPAIPDGCLVRVAPALAEDVEVGDVILVVGPGGRPVYHRLVRTERRGGQLLFQTWGDASPDPDMSVAAESILGIVTEVERGGQWITLREERPRARRRLLIRRLRRRLRKLLRRSATNPATPATPSPD